MNPELRSRLTPAPGIVWLTLPSFDSQARAKVVPESDELGFALIA